LASSFCPGDVKAGPCQDDGKTRHCPNDVNPALTVAHLPTAELPTVDVKDMDESGFLWGPVWAVTEDGIITAVYVVQMKGDLGGMPSF
jgi:hypothetical protein